MAARRTIVLAAGAGVGVFVVVQGLAGPLDPPVGPISPTMRTLLEVEPRIPLSAANTPGDADSIFRITVSGSYYLIGNLTGVAGKSGIEIAAPGVVIDLRGFELTGVPGSLDGITYSPGTYLQVTVRNGTARLWGGDGVDAGNAVGAILSDLHASFNGGDGIRAGNGASVTACDARNNSGDGLDVGDQATVSASIATANVGIGIRAGNGGTLNGCAVTNNTLGGIFTTAANALSRCVARGTGGGIGIQVGAGSTLSDCAASGGGGAGIRLELGCTARGCAADDNSVGFVLFSAGNTVEACAATQNAGDGIVALTGHNSIRDCAAYLNDGDGIEVPAACTVIGNTCNGNGPGGLVGSGIHATGADNRIERNTMLLNDTGLLVDAGGNFIACNTASGNTTNFSTTGTQTIGPIITATGTIASTSPWANFEY